DFIIARSTHPLDQKRKEKLAVWCNVPADHIISAPDIKSIYDVPINFEKENLGDVLLRSLSLPLGHKNGELAAWEGFVKKVHSSKKVVKIAIVGKYFD